MHADFKIHIIKHVAGDRLNDMDSRARHTISTMMEYFSPRSAIIFIDKGACLAICVHELQAPTAREHSIEQTSRGALEKTCMYKIRERILSMQVLKSISLSMSLATCLMIWIQKRGMRYLR